VTGGSCFGYTNVDVADSHVERVINPEEAAVVKRIFALAASGTGFTRIAKQLNAEGALSPRPQQGRPSGWAPSSVRALLFRPIYRGVIVWNQSKKRDKWGQHRQTARPAEEWITVPAPHLRIVEDDLWNTVHERLRRIRESLEQAAGGPLGGRKHQDMDSAYLLTGFARCGVCGGPLGVMSRPSGKGRKFVYGCLTRRRRGPTTCANTVLVRMDRVDTAVIGALLVALGDDVVWRLLERLFDAMEPPAVAETLHAQQAALRALDGKIANLLGAIEQGGTTPALIQHLHARQAERETLVKAIAANEAVTGMQIEREIIREEVRAHLAEWRAWLTADHEDRRQLLREVLLSPIRFTPGSAKSYVFEAPLAEDRLLAGRASGGVHRVASPTGTHERWNTKFVGIAA
jgi:hypothetical protein